MEFSFPKMEAIAFRRNPQGTSKLEEIRQVRQLRNKARKGGHKQRAAGRAGCYRASLSVSQGEIFLCKRSELKEEEKAGCSDCHPMSMHVSSQFKINIIWGD